MNKYAKYPITSIIFFKFKKSPSNGLINSNNFTALFIKYINASKIKIALAKIYANLAKDTLLLYIDNKARDPMHRYKINNNKFIMYFEVVLASNMLPSEYSAS